MAGKIEVVLTAPAKIDGVPRRPGERLTVGRDVCAELAAVGAIGDVSAPSEADAFDSAVAARAEVIARSMVEAAVEQANRASQIDLVAARARIDELEAQLAAATGGSAGDEKKTTTKVAKTG